MKVLVIGRDPKLFDEESEAFRRVREYAGLFDELHIINLSLKFREGGLPKGSPISRNYDGKLFIRPTNSKIAALRWFDAYRLGKKIVREHKIDIVDAQDPGEAGLAAYLISRAARIPFRLQIHTDIFSTFYRRAGWKETVGYWLAWFLLPRADCIRAVSERIKKSLEKPSNNLQIVRWFLGGSLHAQIAVLPIWTDVSKFFEAKTNLAVEARFKNYGFKIVSVGRLVDKEKNFSVLIDAMRDFVKICPKAILVIVGDGPDRENYESRIKNQGLENCVILEKWREDLLSFLKSFDLFVLPSNYEGWGRAVIEAMASDLPVLMTDVGLAGEVVKNGENSVVVPVGDREALINAMEELYIDTEKRRRIAAAGLETVKNLRPRTKEEYLELYKRSLEICL